MQTKFTTSQLGVPLSELPAGTAFMEVLESGNTIFMVLKASHLTGTINHKEFKDQQFADLIFYCHVDGGFLFCIKKSEAKETYVYPVQPVNGVLEFRPLDLNAKY